MQRHRHMRGTPQPLQPSSPILRTLTPASRQSAATQTSLSSRASTAGDNLLKWGALAVQQMAVQQMAPTAWQRHHEMQVTDVLLRRRPHS